MNTDKQKQRKKNSYPCSSVFIRGLIVFLFLATAAAGQGPNSIELTLERQESGNWRAVDPGLVFDTGDRVRFRFRANFDGYLYVMNQATSGKYETLFPREDTGEQNRIEPGKEYVVPATQGWFRITGPPGYDVLYWLVTPLA